MKKNLRQKKSTPAKTHFALANYEHPDWFGELLGYEVLKTNRRQHTATLGLKIRDQHLSPAGRVHGGVVSAFFDFACGAAVFTTLDKNDFCSTVELKVNYFRPIEKNDYLTAKTRVMFRGKRICVVHGLLYKKSDPAPAAMATATFNVVSAKKS